MRLAIVVTGALSSSFIPYWANWLSLTRSDVIPHYLISSAAEKFVSARAVRAISNARVDIDDWNVHDDALHVELGDWMDAMLAYPCSFDYFAKTATGIVDRPSLLAKACSNVPLVLAPGLPPGAVEGPVYRRHLEALRKRDDITVVPPTPARSTSSRRSAYSAAPLGDCLVALNESHVA